jgi:hypothetical protein
VLNFPFIFFFASLLVFWCAGRLAASWRKRHPLKDEERDDFGVVQGATLALLGLLIGFSFSMAVSRYDLRRNYEEEEANAIGTEYVRIDVLPEGAAPALKADLKSYVDLRIKFYRTRNQELIREINSDTARLQGKMWSEVLQQARVQPTPLTTLAVSGMNDVLNSQGYTQAAWWNRIPISAWVLLVIIAICGNLLVGYGAHSSDNRVSLLFVLPLMLSVSFFLIADIDSPRGGLIRLNPQNLLSLSESITR